MTAYLLDTNHAGALMKDDPRMISALRTPNDGTFQVAMPGEGELWFMVYNSSRIEGNARRSAQKLPPYLVVCVVIESRLCDRALTGVRDGGQEAGGYLQLRVAYAC